jgi:exopolysaccharide biosynthesis polyprenyl glycosylphosphotransferase
MHRVLVVGRSDAVGDVVAQFERERWHGLAAVGVCVGGGAQNLALPTGVRVTSRNDPRTVLRAVDDLRADVVAVASHPDLSGQTLRRLAWALDERGVDLIVSPGIVEVAGQRLSIRPVAGLSLLHLERPATRGGRMLIKRVLDRLLGLGLFVVLSPLLAAIAVAIKRTSPGPVLFRQIRIGADGRPFEMLKFRSMVVDAEHRRADLEGDDEGNGVLFKMRNDPRVTRVGALLRRYSLDELPQLWNVVRGDMSLVGPRPPLPEEVIGYSDDATRRLRVRPGMTGLWQVSGRSDLSWEESLRLDLRYVDNWSLALDATILWRTCRAVLSRSGAY